MKTPHRYLLALASIPSLLLAVYAPIPEQDQGKALTTRISSAISHDSNIFGSATNEIDSTVYNLNGALDFNSSVSDQTFLSLGYELNLDRMVDRPGKKTLDSHIFDGRLAHKFSEASNIDITENYQISKNPQSLLAGVPLNTDQSFKNNQFNARLATAIGPKGTAVFKYRNMLFNYDNAGLSALLDRTENLAGVELGFAYLPETKLVGEYRYMDIAYDSLSTIRDKRSNFFMAGFDHNPGKELTVSGRLGVENRAREGEPDVNGPYAELSVRYNYADASYLSAGYGYSLEESSDTTRFNDAKVNRFFCNVQHRITPLVIASGSVTYEPSQQQARVGFKDIDEKTTRFGAGLSWLPTKNWLVGVTIDVDRVSSDDVNREQDRTRFGVNARFTF